MGGAQSVGAFDVVVVGGGIAGLLSAVRLSRNYKVLVLEQRVQLGGRARMVEFCGAKVVTGAGVLRSHKDKLMQALLKEMQVASEKIDVAAKPPGIFNDYDELCGSFPLKHETFEAFGRRVLKQRFDNFVQQMGFTDMLRASAVETMRHYGLEDNLLAYKAVKFDWNALISELAQKAMRQGATILTSHKVVKLTHLDNASDKNVGSQTKTKPNIELRVVSSTMRPSFVRTRKVVIASTASCIKALLPRSTLFDRLHSQPFIRVYAQLDAQSSKSVSDKIKNFKVVKNCLMKISKVPSPGNDVFMIGYADNLAAQALQPHCQDTSQNREVFAKLVCQALDLPSVVILALRAFYHKEGTHYYDELADFDSPKRSTYTMYTPTQNVFVVGEAVSHNQGWTEGAAQTVELMLKNMANSY